MSATTERLTPTRRPDPEPPRVGEDRRGWRSVGRGNGVPRGRPRVGVEVLFDREQSDWLSAESDRTGLDYVELVKKLVDDARARTQAITQPPRAVLHHSDSAAAVATGTAEQEGADAAASG